MLRHVDPPTVVRRVVVDRAACERHSSLGQALRRRARSAPPRRPGGRSKGLRCGGRRLAAQARKAEAREGPQPREGWLLAAWGVDQPAGQPGGVT